MRCASYNQKVRSGHSGITSASAGRKIKACGSIISCFHHQSLTNLLTAALTAGYAAKKTPATTLRHGSCLIAKQDERSKARTWAVQRKKNGLANILASP